MTVVAPATTRKQRSRLSRARGLLAARPCRRHQGLCDVRGAFGALERRSFPSAAPSRLSGSRPPISALFLQAFDPPSGGVVIMFTAVFVSDTPELARLLGAAASAIANRGLVTRGPAFKAATRGLINISPMVSVR